MTPVDVLMLSPVGSPIALKLVGLFVAVIWYVGKTLPTVPLAIGGLVRNGGVVESVINKAARLAVKPFTSAPPVGVPRVAQTSTFPVLGLLSTWTWMILSAVSPSAHDNVPDVLVKSIPGTALPATSVYATEMAPVEPPTRETGMLTVVFHWWGE